MAKTLGKLEVQVMNHLLSGENEILAVLRVQFGAAIVKSKEYSGAGFFVYFEIREEAPRLASDYSFEIDDVAAHVTGLKNGVGFTLFIKNGVINMLEGYTFGEELWPKSIENYELYYTNKEKRNLQF